LAQIEESFSPMPMMSIEKLKKEQNSIDQSNPRINDSAVSSKRRLD